MPTHFHTFVLGPHWQPASRSNVTEQLVLPACARSILRSLVSAAGLERTGCLFGTYADSAATVSVALPPPLGYEMSVHALGAIDALRQVQPEAEWLGMWCCAADTRPYPLSELVERFEEGQLSGLFAEQRVLLGLGQSEGELSLLALRSLDVGSPAEVIPVTFIPR